MALESGNIEGRIYVEGSQNVEKAPKGLVAPKYMGTIRDQRDMSALGRVQVLRVGCYFSCYSCLMLMQDSEISDSSQSLDSAVH